MYRVLAIVGGALALAACSSTSEWTTLDAFKTGPVMDTVRFESEPPGAEAKVSNGQSCRTPCALALPADKPASVTFALKGFESDTEQLDLITGTGEPPHLRPNPVVAELTAAAPVKPERKPRHARKAAAKKPVAKRTAKPAPKAAATAPAAAPAPAPAPASTTTPASVPTFAPPPASGASPWPSPPPAQR